MTLRILFNAFAPLCFVSTALLFSASSATTQEPPKVFWASDPVLPGQAVQINGAGLAEIETVAISRQEDEIDGRDAKPTESAEIIAKSDAALTFVIPEHLESGVFSVTIKSVSGETIFQLNAPDVYWLKGDRGTATDTNGWLRVSGRNIALNDKATVRLKAPDGTEINLNVASPDLWSATFSVPPAIKPGHYEARLWNGAGNALAWRDIGTVTIVPSLSTDKPVMELSASQPDRPDNDDAARVNASLQALSRRGGGTLMLRPGVYRFTKSLTVPDGVALKGEASGLVTLIWKDSETPPDSLIQGVRDFSVENLTIYAQRHFHIIKGGFDLASGEVTGSNIAIRNVIIRASAFTGHLQKDEPRQRFEPMLRYRRDGVVGLLIGGSNIRIEGCDVLTSMRPVVVTKAKGAYVYGNIFRNGRIGWVGISAPDGVIFENNRIIGSDLQATGGGINTFDGAFARNVLIRNNSYETIFGWDREAMTSDGPGGYYHGNVAAAGVSVTLSDMAGLGTLKDYDWRDAGLFVLKGKGLGLVARIRQRDGNVVVLDRDISSQIDTTSVVSITRMQENYLVIGNTFTDTGAAQIFGTGYKHVFAGNTMTRSYALTATSLNYRQAQPNFYLQFLDNQIAATPMLRTSGIEVTGRQFEGNSTLLTLGIVIRDNRLASGSAISVNGRSDEFPAVRNVLIEGNDIRYNDLGISIGPGVDDLVLRNNTSTNVRIPLKGVKGQ
jgi:hypothetical protein